MLNDRIGDEVLDDDNDDESVLSDDGIEFEQHVNTRYYQRDFQFAKLYYYKTNVSL